jgi:trk system potassium uptake protein
VNFMVIGCGRVGAELAARLFQRGHKVTVLDCDASAFDKLPGTFRGHTVQGDVLTQGVLRRAGIEQADGMAVVTNSDAVNAVAARAARVVYGVPNVVVRNYDPRWHPMHEVFGYEVVSSATWDAQRLEQLLTHSEIHAVFVAGNGEVAVYEVPVPEHWQGRRLGDVFASTDCRPLSLTRAGRAVVSDDDALLDVGDVVHVGATPECIAVLRQRLQVEGEVERCSS